MSVHLYDFRWLDTQICEFSGIIDGLFARKKIKIGDKISLEVLSSEKKCVGYFFDKKWTKCPENNTGKNKCDFCRAQEKNFIYTVFDGFNTDNFSPEELEKIKVPHIVYLALFDKDLIKIGVSIFERKILRQIEQGSYVTFFIAKTPDGILARQIETLIKKKGLSDKIKSATKKNFLCPDISFEESTNLLKKIFDTKKNILDEHENLKKYLLKEPELCSWKKYYQTENLKKDHQSFEFVTLKKEEHVAGKIIAIKGSFLVIQTPDNLISINTKDLLGHEINFFDKPDGLKLNQAFQKALF